MLPPPSYGVPGLTNVRNSLPTSPNSKRKTFATFRTNCNAFNISHAIAFNIATNTLPNPAKNLPAIPIPPFHPSNSLMHNLKSYHHPAVPLPA